MGSLADPRCQVMLSLGSLQVFYKLAKLYQNGMRAQRSGAKYLHHFTAFCSSPALSLSMTCLRTVCSKLHKESLRVILLDTRYHLLWAEEVSLGSVNESIAHPRDVFRPAIIGSACSSSASPSSRSLRNGSTSSPAEIIFS